LYNGAYIRITSGTGEFKEGVITVLDTVTPSLTVNFTTYNGTGSFSNWSVGVAGQYGATGATGYIGATGATGSGAVGATPNTLVLRDASADIFVNVMHGTATSAYYADLAEVYATDKTYPVGTVVTVGGLAEVTAVTTSDCYALGAISTNPAYLMNSHAEGQPVALTGRVPMLVSGPIKKGDPIWPWSDGAGWNIDNGKQPFAFALEDGGPGLVECVIK
jgi:hypothetical protein